jgi:hypothetical protein
MIRSDLKAKFPSMKFRVTSSSFAGGDSVDIRWTDGPTRKEVESVVKKYQYGDFDGMTDCYNYNNADESIPQSKYVQCQRDISETAREETKKQIMRDWGFSEWPADNDVDARRRLGDAPWSVLNRAMYDVSFL